MTLRQHIRFAIWIVAVCFGVHLLNSIIPTELALKESLLLNESVLTGNEVWRLITCHFVHTNWIHFTSNAAALLLLFAIFPVFKSIGEALLILFMASLFTGLAYGMWHSFSTYLGLSGVLHALALYGGIRSINKSPVIVGLFLVLVIAKVIFELDSGASDTIVSLIEAPIAFEAHFFGAISGVFLAIFHILYSRILLSST